MQLNFYKKRRAIWLLETAILSIYLIVGNWND